MVGWESYSSPGPAKFANSNGIREFGIRKWHINQIRPRIEDARNIFIAPPPPASPEDELIAVRRTRCCGFVARRATRTIIGDAVASPIIHATPPAMLAPPWMIQMT